MPKHVSKMAVAVAAAAVLASTAVAGTQTARHSRALPASGAVLTFDDEFDTFVSSPNGSKGWMTRYNSGRTLASNHEAEYYSDSSVGVNPFADSNGILTITAAPGPNPLGLPYDSGVITSYKSFSQQYGYFEMRAQLPAGAGLWPAFWLLPTDGTWPPEIDVMEMLGQAPTTIYCTTHTGPHNSWSSSTVHVPDTSKGFHTYGVDWEATTITFYFDGAVVATKPTPPDMHKPMYMLLNLAVGGQGSWPGLPNAATRFPATMSIDYVRVYSAAPPPPPPPPTAFTVSGWGQSVTQGDGSFVVASSGSSEGGARIQLGNGNQVVTITGGNNRIQTGNGNQRITLVGSGNSVTTGSGTSVVSAVGSNAVVTVGPTPAGTTTVALDGWADRVTSTGPGNVAVTGSPATGNAIIVLADGNQQVTLGGSDNTIRLGTGTSAVNAGSGQGTVRTAGGNVTITVGGWNNVLDAGPGTSTLNGGRGSDTFVLNGAGQGMSTVTGFTLSNHDVLALGRTIAGAAGTVTLSNLGSYVTARSAGGDTTLFVDRTGGRGSPSPFALLRGVTATVPQLLAHGSLSLS